MTIEKDLKDNTAALNANTEILQKLYDLKAGATAAPVAAAPVAAPVAAAAPAAAPVAAAPVAVVAKSPEEMNTWLVSEFKRLGNNREPIDAAMSALGVISVTDLPAEKQPELIAAVQAIPTPVAS